MDLLSANIQSILSTLAFKNSGIVTRDMAFEYHTKPCYYTENIDSWSTPWDEAYYSYLYQRSDGMLHSPPTGMRSAVPLGGLGAGTIELRADGSLRDWNIFNNSPGGGGNKVQLDEAFFALKVKDESGHSTVKTLRTHAPRFLPVIRQIEYSGAYPVSRLVFSDDEIPIRTTLYATSNVAIREPARSATPSVVFSFVLENPGESFIDASLMINLPNHMEGVATFDKYLSIARAGSASVRGSTAMAATGDIHRTSAMISESVLRIMEEFTNREEFPGVGKTTEERTGAYAALSTTTRLQAGERKVVTVVFGWHFPQRFFAARNVGNYYASVYENIDSVMDSTIGKIEQIWSSPSYRSRIALIAVMPSSTSPSWIIRIAA